MGILDPRDKRSAVFKKDLILKSRFFLAYRKTVGKILEQGTQGDAFSCENYEWVNTGGPGQRDPSDQPHRMQVRFFCDRAGYRQGMWVILHTIAALRNKVTGIHLPLGKTTKALKAYDFEEFAKFIDEFVHHWNPCPMCREFYEEDIPEIREKMVALFQNRAARELITGSQYLMDPNIYLWVYHNEVSMRVLAGYLKDFGNPSGGKRNEFKLEKVPLFERDKRWPSKELCTDCWVANSLPDAKFVTADKENHFCVFSFLMNFDLDKVMKFLNSVYTGAVKHS